MTMLVTGATGFIGRHVLAELTAENESVLALMRRPEEAPRLEERITALGGQGDLVSAVAGDLSAPNLGLRKALPPLQAVIHLGAAFAWGLDPRRARRTNVDGALRAAELAQDQRARLVMVSGFMLENAAHLQRLGIVAESPETTDWRRVYARAGAYEASKIEGALRSRARARQQNLDYVEIQPGTLSGHSITGELDAGQPLESLISNLATGRLALVPGTRDHWLPLISVDALARLIASAGRAEHVPERLMALDPATPTLAELLASLARTLGRKPPSRHIPIGLLNTLLRIPGLPSLTNTTRESLHFLQTERFDTRATEDFRARHELHWPAITDSIQATAARWLATQGRKSAAKGS